MPSLPTVLWWRCASALAALALCCSPLLAQPNLVPVNDLGAGTYQGFQGGLYPGGSNQPPASQAQAAMNAAQQIVPRNATGQPDPNGLIGFISIGMSNTTHEFSHFEREQDMNMNRNARVVNINGAQGGFSAADMNTAQSPYWTLPPARVAAAGLTNQQVQVAWLKQAHRASEIGPFPQHAQTLRNDLKSILQIMRDTFPNLKLCYISGRTYGGYGGYEPGSYENAFGIKWLIEAQMNGDPGLNHDPNLGPVRAPVLLWGPYLWANGTTPRSDGLVWLQSDFENDGIHPAPSGEAKVANLLSNFLNGEPSAAPWWPKKPGERLHTIPAIADAYVTSSNANFGGASTLQTSGTSTRTFLKFDASNIPGEVRYAKLSLRVITTGQGGANVGLVNNTSWNEMSVTGNNAPPIGPTFRTIPTSSRDGTSSADVTAQVQADIAGGDGVVSFGLTGIQNNGTFHSREAGQPPRLVMLVKELAPRPGDVNGDGVVNVSDLLAVINAWGPCPTPPQPGGCPADIAPFPGGDGVVNVSDLLLVINNWGP